jgi:hypothetical protein
MAAMSALVGLGYALRRHRKEKNEIEPAAGPVELIHDHTNYGYEIP